jgi:hypothetical protein
MSDKRWCLRCGLSKELNEFPAAPHLSKRRVGRHCIACEKNKIKRAPRSAVADATNKAPSVALCGWCLKPFTPSRLHRVYCTTAHYQKHAAESQKLARWDAAAERAEGLR